jgi:hypothetical protein
MKPAIPRANAHLKMSANPTRATTLRISSKIVLPTKCANVARSTGTTKLTVRNHDAKRAASKPVYRFARKRSIRCAKRHNHTIRHENIGEEPSAILPFMLAIDWTKSKTVYEQKLAMPKYDPTNAFCPNSRNASWTT